MQLAHKDKLFQQMQKAVAEGRSSLEFLDEDGQKVVMNLEQVNANAICTPYDAQ